MQRKWHTDPVIQNSAIDPKDSKMQDEPGLLRLTDDQFKDKTITHTRNNGLAPVESMDIM
ncbi:hypothetical protein [Dyadobacter luteus]|uniref:hypothetical protein n=1 Tax=Dyadobacter luteus TaxID=2259619 RepID=UPI0011C08248|nr:hypothetical protein [Dyadobacter luteus]